MTLPPVAEAPPLRHATANPFAATLQRHGLALRRAAVEVLQINLGRLCNLACIHCHVNAGPRRREIMADATANRILDWLAATDIPTVDLTGGAPEMNPHFRHIVTRVRALAPRRRLIDRCNLTILRDPAHAGLAEFLAAHEVEIVASLPCYSAENVDAQRGEGVFDASIAALQLLNRLGYGRGDPRRPLHLVYNPRGATLPGAQAELEADYKRELRAHFGIEFDRLYALANLPIARFASWLRREGKLADYLALLAAAFNPATVPGLMCRTTLSVSWRGEVHDCDFNQMLDLPLGGTRRPPLLVWELDARDLAGRAIATASHCFGCTAGAGSSCGGALA